MCFSPGCWISWWLLTFLLQQHCPQSCWILVCLAGFAHEEQPEVQQLCMFCVHSAVQSVLHSTAPGRARAAGWARTMQEWVEWAVGLSELGASRTKGRAPTWSSEGVPGMCPVIHLGHIPSALLSHWKIKEARPVIEGRPW